jgi:diguanylate cyclase (GGDEF)-like protein
MRLSEFMNPIPLTPKQEEGFIRIQEINFKKYLWIFVLSIILFEIYNISYVLLYNRDRPQLSVASLVYLFMYILLLAVSVLFLCLIRLHRNLATGSILKMQTFYAIFLLLWTVGITIYDQRVSTNTSLYGIISMSIAILAYMKPKLSIPLFLSSQILLIVGIPIFNNPAHPDLYGRYLNLSVNNITAIFISCYHSYSQRRIYKNHCIITEKTRKLDYLAHHDSMTGLSNQRYLADYLTQWFYQTPFAQKQIAVCMMDIDDFKSYNDHFGHLKGDECLIRVAKAMELQIASGILFRYGGEEFLYLLPDASLEEGMEVAEKFRSAVERLQIPSAVPNKPITISCGVACASLHNREDWKHLLQCSDDALYTAKRKGKNNVTAYQHISS